MFSPSHIFPHPDDPYYGTEATSTVTSDCEDSPTENFETPLPPRPRNRAQFIRSLPQNQIDEILAPLERGVIDPNTVFSVQDPVSQIVLPISGREILNILGKLDNGENEGHYEASIVPDAQNATKKNSLRNQLKTRRFGLLLCLCVAEIILIIILAVLLATKSKTIEPQAVSSTTSTTTEPPTASLPRIISNHTKVIIMGGWNNETENVASLEEYYPHNPSKNRMLDVQMLIGTQFSAAVVHDDAVYIVGGFQRPNGVLSSIAALQIFNLTSNEFIEGAPMETARGEAAGALFEGRIFVCGGLATIAPPKLLKSCEYYEPADQGVWSHASDMLTERLDFRLVVYGRYLWAIGGANLRVGSVKWNERYDFASNKWEEMTNGLKFPVHAMGTAIFDEQLWVCGGEPDFTGSNIYNKCQIYDFDQDLWSMSGSHMTHERMAMNLIAFDGHLLAFGGASGFKTPDNSVEWFDKDTNLWVIIHHWLLTRWGAVVVAI